ncbi:hypothetical protein GP486_000116 [Trichoglossum hirsutum]|uniref:Fungal STAND N-terminal Goodbye domain-containing protein n=1 Tax=Trichoglossum hirsutum TaxID=265104 RepID=A0A9P8LJJ6_9PEZI|nr:hypothetical protein GP486_000116 [Trichoglossum hirsutum]
MQTVTGRLFLHLRSFLERHFIVKMADSYAFKELWDRALMDYLRSTDRVLQGQAVLQQLCTTEDLMAQIETSQGRFGDWRRKRHRILSILSNAMRPIEGFAKIAQNSLSATPLAPTSVVFGATLFLMESANGESKAYDRIEVLFGSLGEFMHRLEEYIKSEMNRSLQGKVVAILACLLEILGRSERIIKDGRFKKFMAVLSLGEDEKVKASFDRLSRLVEDEERLVVAVTYATGQRIEGKTDKIDRNTQMVEEKVNDVAASLKDATTERRKVEQNELLEHALCTPAHAKNCALFGEYSEDVLQNSGEWLLAEPAFQEWIDRKCPLLWVTGGPGTGKSFLSTVMISKLRVMYPQDPTRASVGYFYIKEHDQHLQDLSNILKSITLQIAAVDSVFRSHAISTSSTIEKIAGAKNMWQNLFLRFYGPGREIENTALVVIDGLDEAPPKVVKDLLRSLEDLSGFAQRQLRLCFAIFGRPELAEYMTPKLQRCMAHVEIGEKNEGDISAYVKKQMHEVLVVRQERKLKSKKAASKLARELHDKIMAKSDGMFFKVVLIMNQLYDKERVPSLFEAIEDTPPQLEKMIRRVLERLASNEDVSKDDLNEILTWVAYSKRPLAISELYSVLHQRSGKAYDALEGRLQGKFASLFKLSRIPGFGLRGEVTDSTDMGQDDSCSLDFDLSSDKDEPAYLSGDASPEKSKDAGESAEYEGISLEAFTNLTAIDVRFTHASIRDFLVKEGESNISGDYGGLGIGINTRTAELHLASTCLKNIFEWNAGNKGFNLIGYSIEYFMDHLLSIAASRISRKDKQPLIRQLYCLFHDEAWTRKLIDTAYYIHNKALHMWFADSKFSTSIRKDWLAYALEDEFNPEAYEWLQKAANSVKEFFRPLAMTAARMWLTKSGQDDQSYRWDQVFQVWILHCYLNMDENGEDKLKGLNLGTLNERRPPLSSPSQLQALADFAGIEKTQHWHTCFAWTLLRAGIIGEAVIHFNKALEIDDKSWKAMQGLSRCYVKQGEFSQAIDFLTKAIKLVPSGIEAVTESLNGDLTDITIARGDAGEAIRHSQERYAANPKNVDAIRDYIKALYAGSHYDQIVNVVQDVKKLETFGTSRDRLPMLLGGYLLYDEIGSALRARNRIELVQSTVDGLSQIHYFQDSPWVYRHVADFKFKYYDRTDDVMAMLEPVIQSKWKMNLSPEVQWGYGYCCKGAIDILSQIYYSNAVAAKVADGNPDCWISKLRALATHEDGNRDGSIVYRVNNASFLLGTWLRIYGNVENAAWKSYFRPSILEAVDMLGDEDPLNDRHAYATLGSTLLSAGDVPNALAALAVTLKSLEVSSCPSQMKWLKEINFGLWWTCDGPCNTLRTKYKGDVYKELHFCEECYDTCFCEDCVKLVKENKLPFRKCSSNHTFLQVFPIPEEARDVAARFEGVNTVVVQKEWLDGVRRDWS